jgi:hypothetical protein
MCRVSEIFLPRYGQAGLADEQRPGKAAAILPDRSPRPGALDEHLLSRPPGLTPGRVPADVLAIRLHVPCRAVVLLVGAQDVLQFGLDDRVADGGNSLHPTREVACPQVGGADEELGRATVLEAVDPAVLEESAQGAEDRR